MFVCWMGVGMWMGVRCPCPPVRNDIVTPRHLLFSDQLIHLGMLTQVIIQYNKNKRRWSKLSGNTAKLM